MNPYILFYVIVCYRREHLSNVHIFDFRRFLEVIDQAISIRVSLEVTDTPPVGSFVVRS